MFDDYFEKLNSFSAFARLMALESLKTRVEVELLRAYNDYAKEELNNYKKLVKKNEES